MTWPKRMSYRCGQILSTLHDTVKEVITNLPVLANYDLQKELTLENDACEHGLGAVLMQSGRLVTFASCSLAETEWLYAQIETEMLAVVYGLENVFTTTHMEEKSMLWQITNPGGNMCETFVKST